MVTANKLWGSKGWDKNFHFQSLGSFEQGLYLQAFLTPEFDYTAV